MKKLFTLVFALTFAIMTGCGTSTTDNAQTDAPSEETVQENGTNEAAPATEENHEDEHVAVTPTEPGEGEVCSMCNMTVYHQHEEMGKFTGQIVTADGQHLFTDDVSCLMNQIRVLEEEPQAAWARDYNTLEWVPVEDIVPVKANIETPMKMGFALFGTEEAANTYISENGDVEPELSSMDVIDNIAEERYKAKMEKMKESQQKAAEMSGEMSDEAHDMSH